MLLHASFLDFEIMHYLFPLIQKFPLEISQNNIFQCNLISPIL
jgi:hypothetical protein